VYGVGDDGITHPLLAYGIDDLIDLITLDLLDDSPSRTVILCFFQLLDFTTYTIHSTLDLDNVLTTKNYPQTLQKHSKSYPQDGYAHQSVTESSTN
jgi:hypothetical protein